MTGLCKKTLMRNQFSWPFSLMGLQTKPSSQKLLLCIAQHLAVSSTLQRPSENRPTHTKQSRSGVSCQKQHKDRCKTTYPQIKWPTWFWLTFIFNQIQHPTCIKYIGITATLHDALENNFSALLPFSRHPCTRMLKTVRIHEKCSHTMLGKKSLRLSL